MASIFISYSRKDTAFVDWLTKTLDFYKRDYWLDRSDLLPTAEWPTEIATNIESSDVFLYVISPASIASIECNKELDLALEVKKRIIPLVCQPVEYQQTKEPIRNLQWIFCRPGDNVNVGLSQLFFALDLDIDYWHKAAQYLVRARQWDAKAHNQSFTLHGKELAEAEQWLAIGTNKQPSPTPLQIRFITASRRVANTRRVTFLSVGLVLTTIVTIITSILAITISQQNHQLRADAIAGKASSQLLNNNIDQGLLLSAEAYHQLNDDATRNALLSAIEYSPHLESIIQSNSNKATNTNAYIYNNSYSADGKTLMTLSDEKLILWDTDTLKPRLTVANPDHAFSAVISNDGQIVATKSATNVTLWNTSNGQIVGVLEGGMHETALPEAIGKSIVFSPDGSIIAASDCVDSSCATAQITLWNTHTLKIITHITLTLSLFFINLSFSLDGKLLAYSEDDSVNGRFTIWDLAKQHPLFTDTKEHFDAIDFSVDGHYLVTGGGLNGKGIIHVWDATTFQPLGDAFTDENGIVTHLAITLDGKWILASDFQQKLRLYSVDSRLAFPNTLEGHSQQITSIAASPDGKHFVSAGTDDKLLFWNVAPQLPMSLIPGTALNNPAQVALSPDGKQIAVAGTNNQEVIIRDLSMGRQVDSLPDISETNSPYGRLIPYSLAYSKDGRYMAVGGYHGEIAIWNLATHQLIAPPFQDTSGEITSLSFSPDGHFLLSNSYETHSIKIWDLTSHMERTQLQENQDTVMDTATFSPDSTMVLVSASASKNILLWNIVKNQYVGKLNVSSSENLTRTLHMTFSADGKTLATVDEDGVIKLWDWSSHKVKSQFNNGATKVSIDNTSLAFTPDSSVLIFAYAETIEEWQKNSDSGTYAPLAHPIQTEFPVANAILSPDNRLLISAELGGPVEVRYVHPDDWQMQACRIVQRNLTQNEWNSLIGSDIPYHQTCPPVAVQSLASATPAKTKLYSAHVPGSPCDNGGAQWQTFKPETSTFSCQQDGLHITTEAQHSGGMWFIPPSGSFPQKYAVKVTIHLGTSPNACGAFQVEPTLSSASIYTICLNGYQIDDLNGNQDVTIAHGNVPAGKTFILTLTVDGIHRSILINNNEVFADSANQPTKFFALILENLEPSNTETVTFSDFTYTTQD